MLIYIINKKKKVKVQEKNLGGHTPNPVKKDVQANPNGHSNMLRTYTRFNPS